jgi:hypothetical protein
LGREKGTGPEFPFLSGEVEVEAMPGRKEQQQRARALSTESERKLFFHILFTTWRSVAVSVRMLRMLVKVVENHLPQK